MARQNSDFGGIPSIATAPYAACVEEWLGRARRLSRLAGMSVDVESAFHDHPNMEVAATKRISIVPADYSFTNLYGGTRLQPESCWQFQEWC